MGISAPSFDYQSLNAPGGIGQGLGALSGALVDAAARRRQAQVEQAKMEFEQQGLARLEARDLANRSQEAMRFQETANHNRAQEEYQQGQLKRQDGLATLANTRYTEGVARQAGLDDAAEIHRGMESTRRAKLDASAIRLNDARAKAALNPRAASQPRDPTVMTPAVALQYEALAEKQAQKEFGDNQMTYNAAVAKADGYLWNDPMPAAPATLEALRAKYRKNLGLSDKPTTWKTAPTLGAQAPVAPSASSLRDRVTALYGENLDPRLAQSLMEAEEGDADSAAQLEGILQQAGSDETVDPDEGVDTLDLLGNPIRQ